MTTDDTLTTHRDPVRPQTTTSHRAADTAAGTTLRPLRILHLCQPTDGGAAVVATTLVKAGVDGGDQVTVAGPSGGFLRDRVLAAGATWVEVPMTRAPGLHDLQQVWQLRRLLRDHDLVHMHSSKAGALGRLAALSLRRRPRTVFTPHGWSWYVGGRAGPLYRLFERLASWVTDTVVVVSTTELDDGRRQLGRGASIQLIENGVDVTAFHPDGARADRPAGPLLVQVGRLSVQKGQDRTLRALARGTDPSVGVRFVGDGPDRVALVGLAAELGITDRVDFAGTTDPRPHLRAADLVVLPSRWEGMPLALLEAMACGATIIAADCGGSEALGDAGRLIEHEDDDQSVTELVKAVADLLDDDPLRRHYAAAARDRAIRHYDLRDTLDSYRVLWHECDRPDSV